MTSALNPARVEPNPNYRFFEHRLLIDTDENQDTSIEKIGAITYRTKAILTLLLGVLLDGGDHDDGQIISLLEVAINEVNDIEAIQHHMAHTARNKIGNDISDMKGVGNENR
ncbi:hypothetical protein ACH5Y9_03420 [Methylomonas sp. BW4-1]|uniref:hypothetical protein n=1 Tax=Methylomonas sp. BW4-1 TaxID=3376685 RepID=UPI0040421AA2